MALSHAITGGINSTSSSQVCRTYQSHHGVQHEIQEKLNSALLIILGAMATASIQNVNAATSSYTSSAPVPIIYGKNFLYSVAFSVVGNPPSNATLTNVSYSYAYDYPRPTGFEVYLCNNSATLCANITSAASGNVNFTGYGVPANQSLKLYSRVVGSGTMMPLYGGTATVNVTYQY